MESILKTAHFNWLQFLPAISTITATVVFDNHSEVEKSLKQRMIIELDAVRSSSDDGANRLRGKSNNHVESVTNDEFFGCLFNQSESKKDGAAKRIEGCLSAVSVKKIDDNSFADAARMKLFVQYNTSLPSSASIERLFSMAKTL